MKRTLAILLIAVLAAGSVFAAFSGDASVELGVNLDKKTFGIIDQGTSFDLNFELSSANAEAVGEGDIYASIKASMILEVFTAADWEETDFTDTSKFPNGKPSYGFILGDWSDKYFIGLGLDVEEAKIAGQNWYLSILGIPGEPDFAESAIDTWDSAKKKYDVVVDKDGSTDAASVAIEYYNDDYGLELGIFDYVIGGTLTGNYGDNSDVQINGYFMTPEYDINGLTFQIGAAGSADKGAGAVKAGASGKVGYATDVFSLSVASDVVMGIPTVDTVDFAIDADVAANFTYDFVAVDAYYATNVKVNGTPTENLLSAQAAFNLENLTSVPLTVTAGIKDAINVSKIFGKVDFSMNGFGVKLSADVEAQDPNAWNVDAEVSYAFDYAKITAKVGYGSNELLNASIEAENTTLIPGATLKLGWVDADDLLDKDADETNYGKIYAGATIAF